jgi:putative FmdB family regulatory protein
VPIYEFDCQDCQTGFEELVFNRDQTVRCPACGSANLQRRMSTFAVKSGSRFVSSRGGSCDGCETSGAGCSGCSR